MNQHIERAQFLMNQERWQPAVEQLQLALAEREDNGTAHALLALCLLELEQPEEARHQAEQAVHEAPDEGFSFLALASVHRQADRLKDAETAIREAIRLEPWNATHFGVLASIQSLKYQWQACLDSAEQGLACDPDDVACANLRAIALVRLGRREEAGQTIDATLRKNPEDAVSHANQGWTLLHQKEPRRAMEHFREALRLDPNLEWAHVGIIEAMKARHFLYRWILGWFLWLMRFPPRIQVLLVLGLLFGQRILSSALESVPVLAPFATIITVGYLLLVWMSWTASTLFNLVLCTDRFGRMVLNRTQKIDAGLAGGLVLGAAALAIYSLSREPGVLHRNCSFLLLGLMLPVTLIFKLEGRRQMIAAAYAAGLSVVIGMTLWPLIPIDRLIAGVAPNQIIPPEIAVQLRSLVHEHQDWFGHSVTGIVISTWLGMGLTAIPGRR